MKLILICLIKSTSPKNKTPWELDTLLFIFFLICFCFFFFLFEKRQEKIFCVKEETPVAIKWLILNVKEGVYVSLSCYNKCKAATKHSTPYLKCEFLNKKITRPKAIYAAYRTLRCSKCASYHLSTTKCLQLTHRAADV